MEERDSDLGILLADHDHDSGAIRQDTRDRGGQPEISIKRKRQVQHSVQRPLYTLRNRIECCVNQLKNAIASPPDMTTPSAVSSLSSGSPTTRLWISFVQAT